MTPGDWIIAIILLCTAAIYAAILWVMIQQRKIMIQQLKTFGSNLQISIEQLNTFSRSLQINIQSQLFSSYATIFMTLIKYPHLQEVNKHDDFLMSKSIEERTRCIFYDSIIAINEVLYVLWRNGLADEIEWKAWRNWLRYWMTNNEFREVVENSYEMYREDYVEEVLKKLKGEAEQVLAK